MTTKRTIRDRHRKATQLNNPETIRLFAEIEKVPWPRRDEDDAIYEKQDDLAWRLGLHSEFRFDANRVNDPTLIDRPPKYDCFFDGWKRVTDARKALLELARLPPDRPLFWCRECGKMNYAANAIGARQCVRCHKVDYPDNFAAHARKVAGLKVTETWTSAFAGSRKSGPSR
jgi:hypothetical protein